MTITFLFGFLIGIVFSLIFMVIILFQILSKKIDPSEHNSENQKRRIRNKSKQANGSIFSFNNSNNITGSKSVNDPQILIDISDKPPTSIETCKWVNFIAARLLSDINKSQPLTEKIYHLLNNVIFEENSKPDYIGKIQFSDINCGNTPEIGTIKLISPPDSPVSVLEFDVIYSGDASITVYTELWLNWPQKHTACLPVKTKLSVKQFTGKFTLYIPNNTNPICSLYLKEQPTLSLRMITKMGYETILKEPGKIGTFIQSQILKFINQKLVAPNKVSFNLFSFLHPIPTNQSIIPSNLLSNQSSSSSTSKTSSSSALKKSKSNQSSLSQRKTSVKISDESQSPILNSNNISSSGINNDITLNE